MSYFLLFPIPTTKSCKILEASNIIGVFFFYCFFGYFFTGTENFEKRIKQSIINIVIF